MIFPKSSRFLPTPLEPLYWIGLLSGLELLMTSIALVYPRFSRYGIASFGLIES